jgi:tetratricopeptide (TPR) repeat protein
MFVRLSDNNPSALGSLAQVYARGGRTEEARKILEALVIEARTRYVSPGVFASIYFELGERDEAFRWVERAYRERANYVAYIAIDDSFDAVRTDTRYLNLLRRIGLSNQ